MNNQSMEAIHTKPNKRWLTILVWLVIGAAITPTASAKPNLMLAKRYHDDINVSEYWVCEKLDGVRARWNGKNLISRNGHTFATPDWFIDSFPEFTMDGELWSARSEYEKISSITSRNNPHDGWTDITFMIFDLPGDNGTFSQRVAQMRKIRHPHIQMIPQRQLNDSAALSNYLDQIIANGGEGLMLHHQDSRYSSGRSDDLLKLKRFDDAEATVIDHLPGKGKYQGMLGAIKVKNAAGVVFKIGSGFSDAERSNPPPIGVTVTYKHQGVTKYGVPRFAVFMRLRDEN